MKFKETRARSIIKSLVFRTIVVASDLVIIYLLTKKILVTVAVTVFTNLASTVLYFLHERFWNGIAWGRVRSR